MKNETRKIGVKLDASNDALLAAVKRLMNAKIYAETRLIRNDAGEDAALEYLQQFFNVPVSPRYFIEGN
jgi:hypothetical protein